MCVLFRLEKTLMKRKSRNSRHAVRAVVRFHGRLMEDRVLHPREGEVVLGDRGQISLPTPRGRSHFARLEWDVAHQAVVVDPRGRRHPVDVGQPGVAVAVGPIRAEFTRVAQYRLPRSGMLGEGDLILAIGILAMSVFAMQLELVMRLVGDSAPTTTLQPTAELIARLLAEDYAGADAATIHRDTGAQNNRRAPSYYLPVGADGPKDRLGGAEEVALRPVRVPNQDNPASHSAHQPLPPDGETLAQEESPKPRVPDVLEPQDLQGEEAMADAESTRPVPMEEEEGWGFSDWMDVSEDRIDDSFAETIDRAQEKLRLDPEDAWALQQIGYYQYLAEDTERCLATYQKFVDIYPDEPAGYNNLALVYKRKGDFATEETLYLRALALKSSDTHAINNLAVNLAHQERFDEALELMEQLKELTPIDPYANLHRAKIYAAMGNDDEALSYLKLALQGMNRLDTLHHIEFRQDIRVDPAFDSLRAGKRFERLLVRYYGADARSLVRRSGSDIGAEVAQ